MQSEAEIQSKYDNIKFTRDPSPQWDPLTPDATLRSFLGIPDDPDALFSDTLNEYRRPEIAEDPEEIHGFHATAADARDDKDRPILTEENADRWTPKTHSELLASPFKSDFLAAMHTELATLNKYKAWELVRTPRGTRRITLKWVYKIKFKHGQFEKFKARLCGRGFTQREGLDYDPDGISSPVARNSTFNAVLADGVHHRHHFFEFDVKCAYMLAELKEDIYAVLPHGIETYVDTTGKNSLRILKSLYGLRQSGYNWFTKFSDDLAAIGFRQSKVDPCLFTFKRGPDIVRIAIWVDDGLVSTSSPALWKTLQAKIAAENPLSHAGPLKWLLGMAVSYDRAAGTLRLSQESKIDALLERYGMDKCTGVPTPLPPNEPITSTDCPRTPAEMQAVADKAGLTNYSQVVHFCRSALGAYGHLACWGRPDIRQATYFLCRFQARPSLRHFQLVKRMLRYLRQTKSLSLVYGTRHFALDSPLVCQVDSDFIDYDSTTSTSGYVFWLYGCPIACESRKQRATTHNTTEAELIAASLATKMCTYLRRLLVEDFDLELPRTPVLEDNQGCIAVTRGGGNHTRLRHLRIADSYVYAAQTIDKVISIQYVRSQDNVADMFTKAPTIDTFVRLRDFLMGDTSYHLTYSSPSSLSAQSKTAEECWNYTLPSQPQPHLVKPTRPGAGGSISLVATY